jgi:hypothetical protein
MRSLLKVLVVIGVVCGSALGLPVTVDAHAPSGAIFTTVADGTEVNFNIYPNKEAVYLDGGPGLGAPQDAAGLDDGDYYFQVTDPSGKDLLSTDPIACRRFTVSDGVISAYSPEASCSSPHVTGFDVDHGAVTIQLMPYLDTTNPGGEYKVWVTFVEDLDCDEPGNKHCFVPAHSKTDNFKVGEQVIREIDVQFFFDEDANGVQNWYEPNMSGYQVTWIDTHGASNRKWSYLAPEHYVWDNVHIEAVEAGTHRVVLTDQPGCRIGQVRYDYGPDDVDGSLEGTGAGTYPVRISKWGKDWGVYVEVACL